MSLPEIPPPNVGFSSAPMPGPPPIYQAPHAPGFAAPGVADDPRRRPIEGWATAAKVTVGLTMALIVVDSVLGLLYTEKLRDLQAGETSIGAVLDFEQQIGLFTLVLLVTNLVAAGCVITWLYRAAKNAELINPARMNNTAKWAIWGWIVPFMNLARPYHMVKETWEASRRGDTTRTPVNLFRWWWGLWLIDAIIVRFLFRSTANDIDGLITHLRWGLLANATAVVAGVIFLRIISLITTRQALGEFGPPPPAPLPHYVLAEADQPS